MAIQFVGSAAAGKVGATSGNTTIALDSGLTGGIASSVSADDLVIAVFGTGSVANRTLAITDGTTAYTLIGTELYANDTFDTNLRVAYKFMGSTPDASTTFGPTGNTADAGAMAVYVFRGVDSATPLDVAAVTATAINTSRVVPPDITPVTAGAFPVFVGAAAHNGGIDTFTSSDLTAFLTNGGANDTNDVTIGVGHIDNWSSGATNAATWGHSQANSTGFCWAAVAFALRPTASTPFSVDLSAPTVSVTAQSVTRLNAFAAQISSPAVAFTGQSVTRLNAFSREMTAPAFAFTALAMEWMVVVAGFVVEMSAPAFAIAGQAVTRLNAFVAGLSAPAFAFAGQALTRLNAFAAQMSVAVASMTGRDVDAAVGGGDPEEYSNVQPTPLYLRFLFIRRI